MELERERGLIRHWQNAKFDGLPWSCVKKRKRRTCVKLNYSLAEVQNETDKLRKESPESRWSFKFCLACQGFHILRH